MINNFKNNTLIMGILNLSPDSFYDGERVQTVEYLKNKIKLLDNADIIDIGAESSRPGSKPISNDIEIKRLDKFFDLQISKKYLSIDSYKPKVIKYCLDNGVNMINDISGGGNHYENIEIAKEYNVPICIMHMQKTPLNMQDSPKYNNLIDDIMLFFDKRINYSIKINYDIDNLILDPGIGFGKTIDDNDSIIGNICRFKQFGCKILIGLSRKSFLQFNSDNPIDRLYASISMQAISVYNGANIIRTHDVDKTIDSLNVIDRMKKHGNTRIYQ